MAEQTVSGVNILIHTDFRFQLMVLEFIRKTY